MHKWELKWKPSVVLIACGDLRGQVRLFDFLGIPQFKLMAGGGFGMYFTK